jgi:hypothetical protein
VPLGLTTNTTAPEAPGLVKLAVEEAVMARLVTVAGILVLTAVLLAGCGGGGGDDRAKVAANLQDYFVSLGPEGGPFPVGAGPPRVKAHGCKDRHVRVEKGVLTTRDVLNDGDLSVRFRKAAALWACVVKVGTFVMPVTVAVDDNGEVVIVFDGRLLKELKPK